MWTARRAGPVAAAGLRRAVCPRRALTARASSPSSAASDSDGGAGREEVGADETPLPYEGWRWVGAGVPMKLTRSSRPYKWRLNDDGLVHSSPSGAGGRRAVADALVGSDGWIVDEAAVTAELVGDVALGDLVSAVDGKISVARRLLDASLYETRDDFAGAQPCSMSSAPAAAATAAPTSDERKGRAMFTPGCDQASCGRHGVGCACAAPTPPRIVPLDPIDGSIRRLRSFDKGVEDFF